VTRGFTLVEMLLVVIVGMILAGVMVPNTPSLDDQVIVADANILAADLEFAQARAIATGQSHRVIFDVRKNTYSVESPPGNVLDQPLSRKPWVRDLTAGRGTGIVAVSFAGKSAVIFDQAGTPDDGGTVDLAAGAFQAEIEVVAVTGDVLLTLP